MDTLPGNTWALMVVETTNDGQYHRKQTACVETQVRVKRRGKSSPHSWRHEWLGKPQWEQGQIGSEGVIHPVQDAAGRLLERPGDRTPREMTVMVYITTQNPAYRQVAIFDKALATGLYLFRTTRELFTIAQYVAVSYGIVACATQASPIARPTSEPKPAKDVPRVTSPLTPLAPHVRESWTFSYTPGTYTYTIVTTAQVAAQSDTGVRRMLPAISEQVTVSIGKNSDVQVIDPSPSTSVVCDTIATLITHARQLIPKLPERLVINSSWNDSTIMTGCQGFIPVTVKTIHTYTVLSDTLYNSTLALHVKRSDTITAHGEGNEKQHHVSLTAGGTGTINFYFDTAGSLLGSINKQITRLDVTTSGQTSHFMQHVTEHVTLVKTR